MSAIAGLLALDRDRDLTPGLGRMLDVLGPYGPDRAEAWSDGGIALGHCLLATTAESEKETLPLVSADGALALTAHARLDNREELAGMLGLDAEEGRSTTDSELILAAYARWGADCPTRLVGDFAFAVYDRRARVLFCARDRMGLRPFYYHAGPSQFAFASTLRGLLAAPGVPRRLDERRVGDYLVPMLEDKAITFYRDVLRLPPAHHLTVRDGHVTVCRYWSLDGVGELRLGSDDEYAAAFRALFTEAVRCRLRSVAPIGSTLSGGLDSSSVACVARDALAARGERLETFSLVFPDVPATDERRWIDAVLAKNGLSPNLIRADGVSPLADFDRMQDHEAQPLLGFNLYHTWLLCEAARCRGVRVLLDGFDGDTTLAQAPTHLADLLRRGRFVKLRREILALAARFGDRPRDLLVRYAIRPLVPLASRHLYALRPKLLRARPDLIAESFARRTGLDDRALALYSANRPRYLRGRAAHRTFLEAGVLPYVSEMQSAAAFGVELRSPFCDHRLVEFCLALPDEQKLGDGWTRVVMRRGLDGVLPDEVRWRPGKSDLSPAFVRALVNFERQRLDSIVRDPSGVEAYVDVARLRAAWARCRERPTEGDAVAVWRAATLALWLRREEVTT